MLDFYLNRIHLFTEKLHHHQMEVRTFALLRAVAFLLVISFLVFYFRQGQLAYLGIAGGALMLFIFFVSRFSHHEKQKAFSQELIRINQEEISRLALDLSSFRSGEAHLQKDHPYHVDLDIFGDHSIFQLLNRCALPDSERLIAQWLSQKASKKVILRRQQATRELASETDWCQSTLAWSRLTMQQKKKEAPATSAAHLTAWAGNGMPFRSGIWKTTAIALNVLMALTIAVIFFTEVPYQLIYPPIALNTLYLVFVVKRLNKEIKGIDKADYMVTSYSLAIRQVTGKVFQSDLLKELRHQLEAPASAPHAIRALGQITMRVSARANVFYAIADLLFVPDAYLLMDIVRWKSTHGPYLEKWLETIHQLECLISLGCHTRANPGCVFPEIRKEGFYLKGTDIGHPLIKKEDLVRNDYHIEGQGSTDVITGSNMSGKSTFQRTIGVNLVLAQLGAPVYASSMEASTMQIFTSMRTRDDLKEHTSSFYAELKRIRQLLLLIEEEERTFFLLDEILKGTNSEDRHLGSVALIRKLVTKQTMGMVSTHDLALGDLEATERKVRNFSFNSEINENLITFDYKLTRGTCKSFNASQLLKNMGIVD